MDAQHLPLVITGYVETPAKLRAPKDRAYEVVGFKVKVEGTNYYMGAADLEEDFRSARGNYIYIDGTKAVADTVKFYEGLRLGERVDLRVVGFGAFGGGTDGEGRTRNPMIKFVVDKIELPHRAFANKSVTRQAEKAAKAGEPQDATTAAEAKVLEGAGK